MLRVIISTSSPRRLEAAHRFLAGRAPASEVTIVGASRGAADDFVRSAARRSGATFGLSRFSLTELAARTAAVRLAGARHLPGTQAGAEAIAARVVFDAMTAHELEYFAPVASMPGFPKALARTLHELRLAGIESVRLKAAPTCTPADSTYTPATTHQPDAASGKANADIGRLLERVEEQLARAGIDDRAALFRLAAAACRMDDPRWITAPIVFLDVPVDSRAEREFVSAVVNRSPDVLATVPDGDHFARDAFAEMGGAIEQLEEVRLKPGATNQPQSVGSEEDTSHESDLATLRRYIFQKERPPERNQAGDVRLFSAPGEGREAVEIVRRVLDEASRGVPFDEMAVFLRTPQQYLGLLEHACARADVPVYFDRGTQRPDPAGRAFVALLTCAVDGLSAKRFDEYLSLGQVPQISHQSSVASHQSSVADQQSSVAGQQSSVAGQQSSVGGQQSSVASHRSSVASGQSSGNDRQSPVSSHGDEVIAPRDQVIAPRDEVFAGLESMSESWSPPFSLQAPSSASSSELDGRSPDLEAETDSDDEAVVAGTLRSPWKWEELIVESAVVGGRTRAEGSARWRRRLDGLAADFGYRLRELRTEEPESPRILRFERDLRNLAHLRLFALPIVDELADWPDRATWGEWLDRFTRLATRALIRPTRVLQTLADLRPMAAIGPVTLEEANDVLRDRLVTLDWEPPARRYGRLFVGTALQARGRRFRVVFVPGLAERVVPQRPREDPLLLDERRKPLDAGLVGQEERGTAERLLLKIAIGTASERLYLSYPRLDVTETRARVPSFYALDVMRAITGRVPDHRVLASDAALEGGASLAWPAPHDPDRAIDDLEHDLAVLKPLLDSSDSAGIKGRAHYLLDLNPALRRSVISRWARGRPAWSSSDGLIRVSSGRTDAALAAHRLNKRPYSLSALQRFSACPYQFLLSTIFRLEPWDEPEPMVRMDPLTRGSLYHKAQAEFFRAMKIANGLPITRDTLPRAVEALHRVLDRVSSEYAEALAPAIDRVWRAEIEELRRDLGIWVQKLADAHQQGKEAWVPMYFELSFGLTDEGRDPDSLREPVVVGDGFILRGSVDLIEHDPARDVFRVTDHKTGKNRSTPDLIVGGGAVLQPVLYSLAVERGLGKKVVAGRLFYSTTVGGFIEHEIPLDDYRRGQGLQVLSMIDRAVEIGFLPAAPADRACTWCDFRPVCGPREEERVRRKAADQLADLTSLRSMR